MERPALLENVRGHRWRGGGNAVEVVVSAPRRKLGSRASALETVRGVGSRLRPLARGGRPRRHDAAAVDVPGQIRASRIRLNGVLMAQVTRRSPRR